MHACLYSHSACMRYTHTHTPQAAGDIKSYVFHDKHALLLHSSCYAHAHMAVAGSTTVSPCSYVHTMGHTLLMMKLPNNSKLTQTAIFKEFLDQ